jgi:hypothetical protein
MTAIWVAILAVKGLELQIMEDTRKLFHIHVDFTVVPGTFLQATIWKWCDEGPMAGQYLADKGSWVAREPGSWGKELRL